MTSLIMDEERLRSERQNRGQWKSRVTGLEDFPATNPAGGNEARHRARQRPQRADEDDLEYRLAIEASKNEAEADAARRARSTDRGEGSDDDLQKALKLSQEEEELRKRQLEDQNQEDLLFDDTPGDTMGTQPTGFNQGYQQQSQVDWFGNPLGQQQQPQQTGYLNNAYSQPTGQYQNGYGGGYGYSQPQQTGYEQMQQPSQQFLQPQNTFNPWAQQMNGFGSQQQQQPQQPVQEQPTAQPGSNNPWASTSAQQSTASLIGAQPTGSNNPFATQKPQQTASPFKAPTLSSLAEERTANRPNPIQNFSTPPMQPQPQPQQQQQQRQQPPLDPYKANLSALLSSGEGQDTFGNTGDMRIPVQHTAPGIFVNSAGLGSMGRLEASRTGNNPFYSQGSAAQVQYPSQTGFAGSANPFGPRPGQQQQQGQGGQGQQGGSLIDL